MNLRRILLALLCMGPCFVAAQEHYYLHGGDTIRYTYIPFEQPAAVPAAAERKPFLHRVVDYFGESNRDRTFEKKIDITFAGGPSYSKTNSLGLGVLASGLYRIDRTDPVTPPSNVSLYVNASLSGFYTVGIKGNTIFRRSRNKIDYELSFSSMPRDFWGLGYAAATHNPATSYVEKDYRVYGRYLHRFFRNAYVGALVDFGHVAAKRLRDLSYIGGQPLRSTAAGTGLVLEYDSRDFIPNPVRGIYFSLQETIFPKGLNDCGATLWRTNVIFDAYQRVWRGGVAAFDLCGEFNSAHTPWTMLARLGGGSRMRGYYEGRYIDNDLVTVQLELRQHIWNRIGGVVWGGAGNLFPRVSAFRWSHTLPNYGVGLRWEFKNRINIRIDYGMGRRTSGFLVNVNEAF